MRVKIHHSVSSNEYQHDLIVDFWLETPMGPLYFKPLHISSAFMSSAEREVKLTSEIARIRSRLEAYLESRT